MTVQFQPPPTQVDPLIHDALTGTFVFNPIWMQWFINLAAVISASGAGGGGAINHESLAGLLGGSAGQHYHTDNTQYTELVGNKAQGTVYAGPQAGGAAAPAFRRLVPGDLPSGAAMMLLQDGEDGLDGWMGASGGIGAEGPRGWPGQDGLDGEDGLSLPGLVGPAGANGLSIPGLDGEPQEDFFYVGFPEGDHSSFGEMTITDNATATTLTNATTYYQQTAGWTAGDLDDFTFDGTATLTCTRGGNYQTLCSFSVSCDGANQVLRFAIFQNGSLITEHLVRMKLVNVTDVNTGTICGLVGGVKSGDTFDLRIYNETSAGKTVTISDANFSIFAI